jgi:hypothetical protein
MTEAIDERLVDLERGPISEVRFGRSRFLRTLGTALFGFAAAMVASPEEAEAAHGSPPPGCGGAGACHCCSGSRCCESGCRVAYTCGGNQCWQITSSAGGGCYNVYKCCDWYNRYGRVCICKGYVGKVC